MQLLLVLQYYVVLIALNMASWVTPVDAGTAKMLIFSATAGYRHDMISTAIEVLKGKGSSIDVDFDSSEDASQFTDDNLKKYDGIMFLSTTGEVLPSDKSLQNYLNSGGNFIAIHSAADTMRKSAVYATQLGALMASHANLQNFAVDVIEPSHPSVSMLPTKWFLRDEAYNFVSDPRNLGAKVILAADESTYSDNNKSTTQGTPHPLAWYQEKGAGVQPGGVAGRSYYTSLGHLTETWHDELFQGHILGAISWVLKSNTTKAFNTSALVGNGASGLSPTTSLSPPGSNSPSITQGSIQSPSQSSGSTIGEPLASIGLLFFSTCAILFA